MFTGIIDSLGKVKAVEKDRSNVHFSIESAISAELKVDQSVSHNGVCLTVVEVGADWHRVTAVDETLHRTNLGAWKPGTLVNLERCLPLGGRLDGHIVQRPPLEWSPDMADPTKNTICLWYDRDAEDAARFYAKTFPDSRVTAVHRAPADNPSNKEGDVFDSFCVDSLGHKTS